MRTAFERRASTVLYHAVSSLEDRRPFLLPANACPVVPLVLLKARRAYRIIDISPETLCLDADAAEAALRTGLYAGVVYIRSYGVMDATAGCVFRRLRAADPTALIVDDRCLCPPTAIEEAQELADLTLFSTGYAKHIDLGFGGYGFMSDGVKYEARDLPFSPQAEKGVELAYKLAVERRQTFQYSASDWLDARRPGYSFATHWNDIATLEPRASDIKAALSAIYRRKIPIAAQLPASFQTWRFNVLVREKGILLKRLFSEKLFASSHYASLGGVFDDARYPAAEDLHAEIVNLFCDRYYDEAKAELTGEIVARHVAEFGVGGYARFR